MIEDDRTLKMRLAILESQVVDLRARLAEAEESASQLPFSFESIPLDGYRRVMQESLGGEVAKTEPFMLRVKKRTVTEGDTTKVKTFVDVYSPYSASVLWPDHSFDEGASYQENLTNELPAIEDLWRQGLDITPTEEEIEGEVEVERTFYCDIAQSLYDEDTRESPTRRSHTLIVQEGERFFNLNGTDSPTIYIGADPSKFIKLATVSTKGATHTVTQFAMGQIFVKYEYKEVDRIIVDMGSSGWVEDFVATPELDLYWAKYYGFSVHVGTSELMITTNIPLHLDAGGAPVIVSSTRVAMHADDHFDNFIPPPEVE